MFKVSGMTNLLLTGDSGVGKSTLLYNIAQNLEHKTIQGTYSTVIYEGNQRVGWHLHNYQNEGGTLAHVQIQSDHKMGPYGVDMELFHHIMMPQLTLDHNVDLYFIDEIGILASWSKQFMDAMNTLLDSDQKVIAIIRKKPGSYTDGIKQRSDITQLEMTQDNRDQISFYVLDWIKKIPDA